MLVPCQRFVTIFTWSCEKQDLSSSHFCCVSCETSVKGNNSVRAAGSFGRAERPCDGLNVAFHTGRLQIWGGSRTGYRAFDEWNSPLNLIPESPSGWRPRGCRAALALRPWLGPPGSSTPRTQTPIARWRNSRANGNDISRYGLSVELQALAASDNLNIKHEFSSYCKDGDERGKQAGPGPPDCEDQAGNHAERLGAAAAGPGFTSPKSTERSSEWRRSWCRSEPLGLRRQRSTTLTLQDTVKTRPWCLWMPKPNQLTEGDI